MSHIEDALKNDANKSDIQKNINSIIAKMPVMYYNKQTQSMSVSDTLYKQTIQNLNGDDAVIINLQPDEHLQQISTLYSNAYLSSLVTTSDEISHIKLLNSSQSYDVKNQKDDQSQHHALNIHFLLKVESKHIELILRDRSSEYLHFNYTYPTLLKTINGNTNQDLITFDHTMLKSIALRCTQYYMHFLMICELTLGVAAHTFITLCSFIMRCFFIYALTLIVQRRLLPFRTIMSLAIFSGAPLLFLPSGLSSICGLWTMYLVFIGLKQNKKYAW
ncbi:hypothetical protein [Candidatus Sarmatiella mevalonica]|uniref:hypothetical protein n=1 Tax=Candidatus Sarmatiella mevalonica TaxID=2770581 RepID=UPI00192347C7|nr:hypothetical protein [Candidatus Sarmatiella mevalonica]